MKILPYTKIITKIIFVDTQEEFIYITKQDITHLGKIILNTKRVEIWERGNLFSILNIGDNNTAWDSDIELTNLI